MAVTKPTTDALSKLAVTALAGDDNLRAKTQSMFDKALVHAEYILRFGTESERSKLVSAIVPQMMRSLQDQAADANALAQREAYDRMRAVMRGEKPEEPAPAPAKRARKKAS